MTIILTRVMIAIMTLMMRGMHCEYLVPWFFSKYAAFSQILFLLGNTVSAWA